MAAKQPRVPVEDVLVGTTEAAQILGYKFDSAIKKLIIQGRLPSQRDPKTGHHRLRIGDLRAFRRNKVGRPHPLDKEDTGRRRPDPTIYQSHCRHYLQQAGMSQGEFIKAMGVHDSTYFRIERGPAGLGFRNPTPGYRRRASRVLKVPMSKLFTPLKSPRASHNVVVKTVGPAEDVGE